MSKNKLKPCPFCGQTKYLTIIGEENPTLEDNVCNMMYVICSASEGGCGGSGGASNNSMKEAIELWNTRV